MVSKMRWLSAAKQSALIVGSVVLVSATLVAAAPRVNQAVLSEILRSLSPPDRSKICARVVGKTRQQLNVYTEVTNEIPAQRAQASAVANARTAGEILVRHGLSVPAYVEIASPKRWYGIALYDNKSGHMFWSRCTSHCASLGTLKIKRCRLDRHR